MSFFRNICEFLPEFMLHYHICLQPIRHIEFKDTNLYQQNLEYKIFSKFSCPKSFVQFSCPYFKVHLYLSNGSCVISVSGKDMSRHIIEALCLNDRASLISK